MISSLLIILFNLIGDLLCMAADPRIMEWWKLTDPCQIRIPGTPEGQQWLSMKEVYHSE